MEELGKSDASETATRDYNQPPSGSSFADRPLYSKIIVPVKIIIMA